MPLLLMIGNFLLFLQSLIYTHKPAPDLLTEAGQRQRESTLNEYPYSSALPLAGTIRETPRVAGER